VLLDGRPLTATNWTDRSVTASLPTGTRKELEADGWRDTQAAELVIRDDVGIGSPAVTVAIELPTRDEPPPPGPGVDPAVVGAGGASTNGGTDGLGDRPRPEPRP
jgi:hypothetical protein